MMGAENRTPHAATKGSAFEWRGRSFLAKRPPMRTPASPDKQVMDPKVTEMNLTFGETPK